jgi:DNA-binding MarR family transcriptional regulator
MKPPNVTTMIDGLAQRDLVTRERDAADGRRVVLTLTSTGAELLRRADDRCDQALVHIASSAATDQDALLTGIDRWRDALDAVAVDVRLMLQSASGKIPGERS